MKWADKYRTLKVRTNADTPHDAEVARNFGAEGIGLCRTEHMFFDPQRIHSMREMILATDVEGAQAALAKLLPYQREDFVGIFKAMKGLPVTIRLLDPPLHEFLPHNEKDQAELAQVAGHVAASRCKHRVQQLHEANPMLGHRGDRLAITYPEILEMQVQAIIEAACRVQEAEDQGPARDHDPAGRHEDGAGLPARSITVETADARDARRQGTKVEYLYGTMIEVPRAAVTADEIARDGRVLQLRHERPDADDVRLQPRRREQLPAGLPEEGNPRARPVPDRSTSAASASWSRWPCKLGRSDHARTSSAASAANTAAIPKSVEFCHKVGLNYVSCSPFRVPIARLAAAHAAIKEGQASGAKKKSKK